MVVPFRILKLQNFSPHNLAANNSLLNSLIADCKFDASKFQACLALFILKEIIKY